MEITAESHGHEPHSGATYQLEDIVLYRENCEHTNKNMGEKKNNTNWMPRDENVPKNTIHLVCGKKTYSMGKWSKETKGSIKRVGFEINTTLAN